MGRSHNNRSKAASKRHWPIRLCFRKNCGNCFRPNCWNQRYCQQPHCLREVRRWFAAKRQRRRRASATCRQEHAQAERQRRSRKKRQAASQETATTTPQGRAWSRSRIFHEDFCDRPGCYEPRRTSPRAPAKYCGDDCRQAVRRVLDRERKWKRHNTYAGRYRRTLEYARGDSKMTSGPLFQDREHGRNTASMPGGSGGDGPRGRRLFAVF